MAYGEYLPVEAVSSYEPMRMYRSGCDCPQCSGRYSRERYLEEELYRLKRDIPYIVEQEIRRRTGFASPLGLPEPNKSMSLTVLAKKIFDRDLRALVKAGIVDESLEVTTSGSKFLLAHYLSDNKTKLAKAARLKIKEDKKEEEEDEEE